MGTLADNALRAAIKSERMRAESLADIRKIDNADNGRSGSKCMVTKAAVTKQTEADRISVHEIAQRNPLLRGMLRKLQQ